MPTLRFPEFSGVWKERRLGDLFTFKNGVNADKSMYGRGRKFINVMDVISDAPIYHDSIIGSVDISDREFAKNEVQYGDILFQRSSETREEVGQSNVYLDTKPATFGGFVIRGRPSVKLDPLYLDSLLKTQAVRKDVTSRSGGSTRYNIGQDSLEAVTVFIPPTLNEQRRISSFLDRVDARKRLLDRQRKALTSYKAAVMQRIFSQQLRFKQADGSSYPDWCEKRLGDVLTIGGGRDYKHLSQGSIPVYGTGGYMTSVDEWLYDGESVCIGRKGTINSPIFLTGKFWTVDTLFYTHSFKDVIPRYVFAVFQRINWLKYSEASGVPSLSKSIIENILIAVPSLGEQQAISEYLTAIDQKLELVSARSKAMRVLKKTLLKKMFL